MKYTTKAMSSSADEVAPEETVVNGGESESQGSTSEESSSSSPSTVVSNGSGGPNKPSANKPEDDFSDYLWMENMEEYDQEIMRQLEEDIMISHYTEMYEDSLLEDGSPGPTTASLCVMSGPILPPLNSDSAPDDLDDVTQRFSRTMAFSSRLNPNAQEFVPKTFSNVYPH